MAEIMVVGITDYVDDNGFRISVEGALPEHPHALVDFARQGGGFVNQMPRALFDVTFKQETLQPAFVATQVRGDWFPHEGMTLPAYSNGLVRNGWAMPYFEKAAADDLLKLTRNLNYDPAGDAYVATSEGAEDPDVFGATSINVAGKEVKVYAIGAGSWCWDQISPEESEMHPGHERSRP